jgi:hypothetical protein
MATTASVSVNVPSGVAVIAKSTSKIPDDHVVVINLSASGGTNNAGQNVVSADIAFRCGPWTGGLADDEDADVSALFHR